MTGFVALFVAWRARRSKAWTAVPAALGAAAGGALLVAASTTQVTGKQRGGKRHHHAGTDLAVGRRTPGHGDRRGHPCRRCLAHQHRRVALVAFRAGRGAEPARRARATADRGGRGRGRLPDQFHRGRRRRRAVLPACRNAAPVRGGWGSCRGCADQAVGAAHALSSWDQGLVYGVGGVVLVGLLAAASASYRLFKHRSTWLGAVSVTAALAAFLAWAMNSAISVPDSLGTDSMVSVNVLVTAGVGAVLGAVVRFFAGRPKTDPTAGNPAPAPREETDIEELLNEINGRPT